MSAAQPGFVVVGRFPDGSGNSADVYGPYNEERARQVAKALNEGMWQSRMWEVFELKLTPWETTRFTMANPALTFASLLGSPT